MRFELVAFLWMLWHVLVVGGILLWFGVGMPGTWAKLWAAMKASLHEALPHGHDAH